MGLLDWFSGGSAAGSTGSRGVEKRDGWLTIDELDFFGQYAESPNGEYTMGWAESPAFDERGRKNPLGKFVLLKGVEVILSGEAERPNDGHVSDVGVFAFCDWMFTDKLRGTFYVIGADGTVLVKQLLNANLNNCGISADGRFAVCATYGAEGEDSNVLCFFDVEKRSLIWKKVPETGPADAYGFTPSDERLSLRVDRLGTFDYDFSGRFLDAEKWETAQIEKGISYEVLWVAQERFERLRESGAGGDCSGIWKILEIAAKKAADDELDTKARVERLFGEICEYEERLEDAVRHYENAIGLNPKVGVKRRLTALKLKGK